MEALRISTPPKPFMQPLQFEEGTSAQQQQEVPRYEQQTLMHPVSIPTVNVPEQPESTEEVTPPATHMPNIPIVEIRPPPEQSLPMVEAQKTEESTTMGQPSATALSGQPESKLPTVSASTEPSAPSPSAAQTPTKLSPAFGPPKELFVIATRDIKGEDINSCCSYLNGSFTSSGLTIIAEADTAAETEARQVFQNLNSLWQPSGQEVKAFRASMNAQSIASVLERSDGMVVILCGREWQREHDFILSGAQSPILCWRCY